MKTEGHVECGKSEVLRVAPRRKWLLGLMAQMGQPLSMSALSRIIHELVNLQETPMYGFIDLPGQGPCSFTLEYDFRVLADKGLIEEKGGLFATSFGKTYVNFFAENLKKARPTRRIGRKHECGATEGKVEPGRPMVFSVGYEKRTLEEFLSLLLNQGVQVLVDVRKNPLSRKFGFSKKRLKEACKRVGLDYRHEPDLGIPSAKRKHLSSKEEYERLFDEYERTVLPRQISLVKELVEELVEKKRSIALMCMERQHNACHRSRLIAQMQALAGGRLGLKKL